MDTTYSAPQYAYLTPQLEDDHVLPSSRTYLSQSSSCSTPEYIADVQFDWEVANVDGLRFNSGLWPPPTTPFPERYGESLPRQISKHEEDPLWPFASRDISQSVPHHDSLLGESFDSLMKSINQQPNYNPSKRAEPRDFPYFTSAHMHLDDPSLAPLQSSHLFDQKMGPYIHSSNANSEPSLARRSPHLKGSHNRGRSSSVKTRRTESSGGMHKCDSCAYSFSRARDLTRHYRLHTGEKPYKCEACDERFIRSDARKRHWDAQPSCRLVHDQASNNKTRQ